MLNLIFLNCLHRAKIFFKLPGAHRSLNSLEIAGFIKETMSATELLLSATFRCFINVGRRQFLVNLGYIVLK